MNKLYKFSDIISDYYVRTIYKPVDPVTIYRAGAVVPVGAAPGNIESIDYTNGLVTFKPFNTFTATNVTQAATAVITVNSDLTGLVSNGDKLLLA